MRKEHLLIIRFSALGDVAMTIPVVYSLAHQYPDLRITMLSRPFARPLFDDLAPNVNFMSADLKREYRGVKGLNSLYRRLVAKQFTHIADFHSVLRSDYLRMRFNLGRYRVEHLDKHRRERRQLINNNNVREQMPSAFQNYADVLSRLGFPIHLEFTSIFGPEGGNLNMLPAAIGPKNHFEQWIGLAPFAAHKGKVYPPEQTEQVLRHLVNDYSHCRIFLFGRGEQEEEWFSRWCSAIPQCINVSAHASNMYMELIVMSHLDVMISMDSANMHLASLVGVPVVSIWGATHPVAGFMGWNQSPDNVVQLDMSCRPCSIFGQKVCQRGDYACLHDIKPEVIYERINGILLTKQKQEL